MAEKVKSKPFMEEAIELAGRGFGMVEPNPMVGCVIVKDGRVIGRGWHKQFGGPHAEINALEDVRKNGEDANGALMCVTLEPCCHHGKTGPCTQAIIEAGIAKVVVAMVDPSDKVAGKGIRELEEAEIKVSIGTCERKSMLLNPAFIKTARDKKPWTILKWAQTLDGKLAPGDAPPGERYISSQASRKDVHKLRRSVQAVLVGIGTVLDDDPLLNPRPDKGRKPMRVVLDSKLRTPADCQLVKTAGEYPLLIVTSQKSLVQMDKLAALTSAGAEVITLAEDEAGRCRIDALLDELGERGVQRLLVEGGIEILKSFLASGLADELMVYVAPRLFGSAGAADIAGVWSSVDGPLALHHSQTMMFEGDAKMSGLLRRIESY